VEHGPSIHDCAFTARYAVVMDLPVTFSLAEAMRGTRYPYRWNPEHRARIGLLARDGRGEDTIWIEIERCYIFHTANAYDLPDGRVVLDAVTYDSMFAGEPGGPDQNPRGLERFILVPAAGRAALRPALSLCLYDGAGGGPVRDRGHAALQARPGGGHPAGA